MQNNFFTSLWFFIKYINYEIYYYFLGTAAIIEDIFYHRRNKCDIIQKDGEVAVITGGSRGIGLVVVKKLLQCNMHVIIGCRNVEAGNKAVQKIRSEGILTGKVTILNVDMASMDSIRNFAAYVLRDQQKIHVLINNAGIMFPPYSETVEGYESQWGVNYMGHFLLSHLLLKRLKDTGASSSSAARIVNVSSCAHLAANVINFNDINMKSFYIPSAAYAQSKLAQLMFTKTLNRQLLEEGAKVEVFAVHPGLVDTDIFNGTPLKLIAPWFIKLLFKTPDQGSLPILYASISPRLAGKGGSYISNCRISSVSKTANEPLLQAQLFQYSNNSLGIESFGQVTA